MEQDKSQLVAKVVLDWLSNLEVGEGNSQNGLAIFPVLPKTFGEHHETKERLDYRTLTEALDEGSVQITEQPAASVSELIFTNRGAKMVLVLDGEEIVGGKQNRMVNASFLVAAEAKVILPVSCVEHGRWHDNSPQFSSGESGYFSLRREKAEQVHERLRESGRPMSDQQAIWRSVAEREAASGRRSGTGAMNDLYRNQDESIAGFERAIPYTQGATGLIAAMNGQVVGADIFDQPGTAEVLWPKEPIRNNMNRSAP